MLPRSGISDLKFSAHGFLDVEERFELTSHAGDEGRRHWDVEQDAPVLVVDERERGVAFLRVDDGELNFDDHPERVMPRLGTWRCPPKVCG